MSCHKKPGQHYAHRYPVKATCRTTGAVYEWPSIKDATLDTGFTYNMVKLAISGQVDGYSGLDWETSEPLRSPGPSPRIAQAARLYQQGLTGQQMADRMGISLNTVKFHLQRAKALKLITLRKMSA